MKIKFLIFSFTDRKICYSNSCCDVDFLLQMKFQAIGDREQYFIYKSRSFKINSDQSSIQPFHYQISQIFVSRSIFY